MKVIPPDWIFFLLIAAVTLLWTAVISPGLWYVFLPLLLILLAVLHLTRSLRDRAFYLGSTGILVVIAAGTVTIWMGLVLSWLVGGMVMTSFTIPSKFTESSQYLLFAGATLLIASVTELYGHVFILLFVLGTAIGLSILALIFRDFRLRREYTRSEP